jgi:glyoxylase-like metal-dependent hydrolase (beta-lactamase superfamily II)
MNVKFIINTHSNADHIGGNKVIEERTGARTFCSTTENAFIQNTILEPSFLYGAFPFKDLRNKFLMAKNVSSVENIETINFDGIEILKLPGHYYEMIGIKTKDNVCFLGDSLFSKETIEKYKIFFIYDVDAYLKTLDFLSTLEAKFFICSHIGQLTDLTDVIESNRKSIEKNIELILNICKTKITFEGLLKRIFESYSLDMNINQYVLVGSTIRSYVSYLIDNDKIRYMFEDNNMLFESII